MSVKNSLNKSRGENNFYQRILKSWEIADYLANNETDSEIEDLENLLEGVTNFPEIYETLKKLNASLTRVDFQTRKSALEFIDDELLTRLESTCSDLGGSEIVSELNINELNKKDLEGRKVRVKELNPGELNEIYRKERDANFPVGRIAKFYKLHENICTLVFPKGNYNWSRNWEGKRCPEIESPREDIKNRLGIFYYNEIELLGQISLTGKKKLRREINRFKKIVGELGGEGNG